MQQTSSADLHGFAVGEIEEVALAIEEANQQRLGDDRTDADGDGTDDVSGDWLFVHIRNEPDVKIQAPSTTRDKLLDTLRQEVRQINKNVRRQLGKAPGDPVTKSEIITMCLQPLVIPIFDAIKAAQADGVAKDEKFTVDTLSEAIRAFAGLSFYRETPGNVLDPDLRDGFPFVNKNELKSFLLLQGL